MSAQTGCDQTGASDVQGDVAPAKRVRVCYFEEERILRVMVDEADVFEVVDCQGPPVVTRMRRLSAAGRGG